MEAYSRLERWNYLECDLQVLCLRMLVTVGRTPADGGSTGMNCEVWNVDDCKSDRSGGQVDVWDVQLTLI